MKHQEAEKKRRLRLWEKNRENIQLKSKTLIKNDDQKISAKKTNDLVMVITATGAPISEIQWHSKIGHCQFCGIQGDIVKKFPRRGYGLYKKWWSLLSLIRLYVHSLIGLQNPRVDQFN